MTLRIVTVLINDCISLCACCRLRMAIVVSFSTFISTSAHDHRNELSHIHINACACLSQMASAHSNQRLRITIAMPSSISHHYPRNALAALHQTLPHATKRPASIPNGSGSPAAHALNIGFIRACSLPAPSASRLSWTCSRRTASYHRGARRRCRGRCRCTRLRPCRALRSGDTSP